LSLKSNSLPAEVRTRALAPTLLSIDVSSLECKSKKGTTEACPVLETISHCLEG